MDIYLLDMQVASFLLQINKLTPEQRQQWYDDPVRFESRLVGPVFNKDYYNRIKIILDELRKGQ
jgi:hypothetical protein